MKLDERITPDQEISVKQQKEIKYIFDSMLKPHEGHPIFEVDLIKKEVRLAQLKVLDTVNINTWQEDIKRQDILKKEGCYYFSALNKTNAMKKLDKKGMKGFVFVGEEIVEAPRHKHRKIVLNKI